MSKVYYKKINNDTAVEDIQKITKDLLNVLVENENIQLKNEIPLKVHFGEEGNQTYIKSENYEGIIEYLKDRNIKSSYIETNVLYGGQRNEKKSHLKLAKEHGFTQLPIIIADGDYGEDFLEIEINKNAFKSCKIGKKFENYKQLIVISHFKGHAMAGFGGAIKQLSMGYASRGGKLAMHLDVKPYIIEKKCRKCNICKFRCNHDAIIINENKSYIDHEKCVGCGACVSACPHKAISIINIQGILNAIGIKVNFKEKLVEYAYAAQLNKNNIYINFVKNITKGCDCEPRKMKPIIDDVGIFISSDPVAIDKACYDVVKAKGHRFRGYSTFKYAKNINFGDLNYELIELD